VITTDDHREHTGAENPGHSLVDLVEGLSMLEGMTKMSLKIFDHGGSRPEALRILLLAAD